MALVSQIIEKNLFRLEGVRSGLWLNPELDSPLRQLKHQCDSLRLFSQDHGVFMPLKRSGESIEFAAFPKSPRDKYDWIMMNLPREKALLDMMLACTGDLLSEQGSLWLAGENRAGIKSADKILKRYYKNVVKLDSARHCSLFEANSRVPDKPFEALDHQRRWKLDCMNVGIDIISYPGVFAHGHLDPGTALLLQSLEAVKPTGEVLDFACGAGVIGACIAARHANTRMTFLDSNALALRACRETLAVNHLEGQVVASDGIAELERGFDLVVSNPPIHNGVRTDTQLGMRLLDPVVDLIRPGGKLIIVANIHLPYERWLTGKFTAFTRLGSNDGFKVLEANK